MIHDFATISKSNPQEELRPQRREVEMLLPQAGKQRQLKLILLTTTVATLLSIGVYTRVSTIQPVATEFTPGILETQEYQKENMLAGVVTEHENPFENELVRFDGSLLSGDAVTGSLESDIEVQGQAAFKAAINNGQTNESGFGFYDSLQASTWDVPVQKGVYLTEEDMKRASYTYMLQAASMRSLDEALALVDKLKEIGMEATYTKSGGSFGTTWYRVNVGPFTDVSVMNKAEDRLVAMRMMPLKRRIK